MTRLTDIAAGAIDATLKGQGFVLDGADGAASRYRGVLRSGSVDVPVEVIVTDPLFLDPPIIRVAERTGKLAQQNAHLMTGDALCYHEPSLVEYDPYNAGGAILRCLDAARSTLELLLHGNARADLEREFLSYWKASRTVYADLPANGGDVTAYRGADGAGFFLATSPSKLKAWGRTGLQVEATRWPVLAVATDQALRIETGFGPGATLASFQDWLFEGGFLKPRTLDRALGQMIDDGAILLIKAPNGHIGVWFRLPELVRRAFRKAPTHRRVDWVRRHPEQVEIRRLDVEAIDGVSVVEGRLGGGASLLGKKVAIIGCGAIGSAIAPLLVRAGAGLGGGELDLYDPDILKPENLGRHTLGAGSVGRRKARALAVELERFHADVAIHPFVAEAQTYAARLARRDLVVNATGSNAFSLILNNMATAERSAGRRFAPVLNIAVHGNGVAVQTVLVDGPQHACFKCLRPNHGRPYLIDPLKPGVATTMTAPTCGVGGHIPYSASAPTLAAALGLQAALEWAANPDDPGPRVRTRIIDAALGQPQKDKSPGPRDGCPECGSPPADA